MNQVTLKNGQLVNGRYQILERLGEGGYSVVYRAYDESLAREVAIKVLKLGANQPELDMERYYREGRILAQLRHPNIISFYAFELLEDGSPMAVMEYLKGKSLSALIAESGSLDLLNAKSILLQLAEGLSCAHSAGVVHRDLSPSNVFLCGEYPKFQVKIIDFGLSKIIADLSDKITKTGQILGSPPYMSPEQLRGAGLSPAADIYAFGCIMYEILCGKQAFWADSLVAILHLHQLEFPAEPAIKADSQTAALYKAIILRCLQKDAGSRFSSCDQLIAALQGEFSLEDVLSRPKQMKSSWISNKGSAPTAAFIAVGILSLLLFAGVFLFYGKSQKKEQSTKEAGKTRIAGQSKIEHFEKVLKKRTERYGKANKNIIQNLEDLAEAYETEGQYPKATALREQAMSIRVQEFGEFDRKQVPTSGLKSSFDLLSDLARNYRFIGQHDKALDLYKRQLDYRRESASASSGIAGILADMGSIYNRQGNYLEADKLFRESIKLREEDPVLHQSASELFLGSKGRNGSSRMTDSGLSLGLADNYYNLARNCRMLNKTSEARNFYQKALDCLKVAKDCGYPATVSKLSQMATDELAELDK